MAREKEVVKKLKIGTEVTFYRRNGQQGSGRIQGYVDGLTGAWVLVNSAPKGKPVEVTKMRLSQVSA